MKISKKGFSRREVLSYVTSLKGMLTISAASYAQDSVRNTASMAITGQNRYEGPLEDFFDESLTAKAIEDTLKVDILDISEQSYDTGYITRETERAIEELEDVSADISYTKPEGEEYRHAEEISQITENLAKSQKGSESCCTVENCGSIDCLNEKVDRYSDNTDITVLLADNSTRHNGLAAPTNHPFAHVNSYMRDDAEEVTDTTTHEIAHLLGLPHTKFMDLERNGYFGDVMSYTDGEFNIPQTVYEDVFEDSSFGRQSHENFEQIKDCLED